MNELTQMNSINKRKIIIKTFLKRYFISLLCILLLMVFIVLQSLSIKKIEFVNENTYSEEVYDYLNRKINKGIIFNKLQYSVDKINNDIKKEFYYYEWINIKKKGNRLLVIIDMQDEKSYLDETSNIPGDIIANKSGVIRYYFIKKGVNLIKDNQTVLKDELLVSGNLKYYNDGKYNYIHPLGIILAEVVDTYNIKVNKVNVEYVKTGKIQTKYSRNIFNKTFLKKCDFDFFESKEEVLIDLKIYKKIKKTFYEVKEVVSLMNKDEANIYSLSLIEKKFNENRIHEKEKILSSLIVDETEDENYYYYKYIVKKIENISLFRPVKLEDSKLI